MLTKAERTESSFSASWHPGIPNRTGPGLEVEGMGVTPEAQVQGQRTEVDTCHQAAIHPLQWHRLDLSGWSQVWDDSLPPFNQGQGHWSTAGNAGVNRRYWGESLMVVGTFLSDGRSCCCARKTNRETPRTSTFWTLWDGMPCALLSVVPEVFLILPIFRDSIHQQRQALIMFCYMYRACRLFYQWLERVIQAQGGYIKGRCHNPWQCFQKINCSSSLHPLFLTGMLLWQLHLPRVQGIEGGLQNYHFLHAVHARWGQRECYRQYKGARGQDRPERFQQILAAPILAVLIIVSRSERRQSWAWQTRLPSSKVSRWWGWELPTVINVFCLLVE